MLRSRILWELFAGYVVLILLSTAIVGVLVSKQVEEETLFEIERSLDVRAPLLRWLALEMFLVSTDKNVQERIKILGEKTKTRLTVIKLDGVVLADSQEDPKTMDNHVNRPEILAAQSHGHGMTTRFSNTMDKTMMYYALTVEVEGNLLGYVRLSLIHI